MNEALKKAMLKWALVTLALLLVVGCSRNSSSSESNQNQKKYHYQRAATYHFQPFNSIYSYFDLI